MIWRFIGRLARDRKGATAIEYGLIAALVVLTMMAAFVQMANTTVGMWGNVQTKVVKASSGG